MDPKQFRQIIKEEVTTIVKEELKPIDKRLGNVEEGLDTVKKEIKEARGDVNALREDVDGLKKDVKEMSENVDAARGDIENLHMDVKGIRDKEGLFHSRNKREIDEIKTHLGMPLMSDIP
ncbi:hypothetical protein HYS92_02440 [Candidatus Daviesbacteria bacterium]|nr:hypothetical protein [Candidatus Daviesbacteria bacterium]